MIKLTADSLAELQELPTTGPVVAFRIRRAGGRIERASFFFTPGREP